jgi:cytochrome c oxidase subunit 2
VYAIQFANAAVDTTPKKIDIVAKKYQFTPNEIVLKKGEPVVLRLTTEDRSHGFMVKPLNVDADIAPGKTTEITVTPTSAGDFTVICDHYCGLGHGGMKMKISVVQ